MSTRSWQVRRGTDLGLAIAEARRSKGLTQAELAEEIQVSRPYLTLMENGRSSRLLDHLLRALRRLGAEVTVTWPAPDSADE